MVQNVIPLEKDVRYKDFQALQKKKKKSQLRGGANER